ncbi:hypothetical protein MVEN_00942600 [Mycena venus]|uniref:Uncharacterized protein n=1 Tax=Mycena venus TaxID=2733690 RepID=A0A8H6YD24_9AGAR|nr:hypothetical protein MVEN_00942600 [Mycena venus]
MFKPTVAAFLATLSLSSLASAGAIQARDELVLFNGQNVTFDYSDSILPGTNMFGMGVLPTGIEIPPKVTSPGWEGPVVLNIDDMDEIPATYVLQYPFHVNGLSYTVRLFQYNVETLDIAVPNVHNATFTWVNIPGQDV